MSRTFSAVRLRLAGRWRHSLMKAKTVCPESHRLSAHRAAQPRKQNVLQLKPNWCSISKLLTTARALAAERPNVYSSCCPKSSLAPEERNMLPVKQIHFAPLELESFLVP